jgi:sporulation-control protein spo0M
MWIFHTEGLLSIVEDRNDKGFLMVRARKSEHITKVFPRALPKYTPNADYHWRVSLPRYEVALVIAQSLDDINYDNFKNAANPQLQAVFHDVWADGLRLENVSERSYLLGPDEDELAWPRVPY